MQKLLTKILEFRKKGGTVNLHPEPDPGAILYAKEEKRNLPWLELIGNKKHAKLMEEINQHLIRVGVKSDFHREGNRIDCHWKTFNPKHMDLEELLRENGVKTKPINPPDSQGGIQRSFPYPDDPW